MSGWNKPFSIPVCSRPVTKEPTAYLVRASKGTEHHSIPCMSLGQAKSMDFSYTEAGFSCTIVPLFEVEQ